MRLLSVSLLAVATALLTSCVTGTDEAAQAEPEETAKASAPIARTLDMFRPGPDQACYDRGTMPSTMVVDTHNHFRPFGGAALPFEDVVEYMEETGVLFANVYGIGQSLPVTSGCEYYLDCIGTPALPSMKNDFANAANMQDYEPDTVELTLSMTFPDLARPETIPQQIAQLDRNYDGEFQWMGEVNLVKQALFGNFHRATPSEAISRWGPFMTTLRERGIPIAIHSDLGSDAEPEKYLPLFEQVLRQYPDNKIVWMHMGLSKELKSMPVEQHIAIMKRLMDAHPNLLLDISWRVVPDNYFNTPEKKAAYVALFETYPDRILTGTDFVASHKKNFDIYQEEVEVNSFILADLNNKAFRQIALGESYFRLMDMPYRAPEICTGND